MKFKEIHLDFTPLLDVTLIILFYFILFSGIGNRSANEAEQMKAEAQQAKAEAEYIKNEAEQKMSALEAADGNKAALAKALEEYGSGSNLNFIYSRTESGWELDVKRGDEQLGRFDETDDLTDSVLTLLDDSGYGEDSVLLLGFTYDSGEYLISARNAIDPMLAALNEKYSDRVFISTTNIHKEETENEDQKEP